MIQQRILPAIWIAATMLFIGLVPQLMADVNAESNETDWAQTNGPYGGHVYTLYATPEGVLFAGMRSAGIFRSTDLGDSWTPLHYGLGNSSSVTTMERDGTEYYIGTYYKGVFQWRENKKWWKPIGSLRRRVDSLAILDGFLYAGTNGGGVLRIPIEK